MTTILSEELLLLFRQFPFLILDQQRKDTNNQEEEADRNT
jgi:hypothetical protein